LVVVHHAEYAGDLLERFLDAVHRVVEFVQVVVRRFQAAFDDTVVVVRGAILDRITDILDRTRDIQIVRVVFTNAISDSVEAGSDSGLDVVEAFSNVVDGLCGPALFCRWTRRRDGVCASSLLRTGVK